MARGSLSKEIITKQLFETFEEAFLNGKEIRIPMKEGEEEVQIKITLTTAKTNVEHQSTVSDTEAETTQSSTETATVEIPQEPTKEEKSHLQQLIQKFF